jgi:hypothetical protein
MTCRVATNDCSLFIVGQHARLPGGDIGRTGAWRLALCGRHLQSDASQVGIRPRHCLESIWAISATKSDDSNLDGYIDNPADQLVILAKRSPDSGGRLDNHPIRFTNKVQPPVDGGVGRLIACRSAVVHRLSRG